MDFSLQTLIAGENVITVLLLSVISRRLGLVAWIHHVSSSTHPRHVWHNLIGDLLAWLHLRNPSILLRIVVLGWDLRELRPIAWLVERQELDLGG